MNILIKNARVVDSSQDFNGDILIEDGIIKEVGLDLNREGIEVIDAKGPYCNANVYRYSCSL